MMLPVKDIERSIDFYTRLLGMGIARWRDSEGKEIKAVFLSYGDEENHTALELVENKGSKAPAKINPWDGHISIQVPDLIKLSDCFKSEGVRFIRPAGPLRPGRKDLLAIILDPDGYQIALTERSRQKAHGKR
jgi:lactoylglutathione lyase